MHAHTPNQVIRLGPFEMDVLAAVEEETQWGGSISGVNHTDCRQYLKDSHAAEKNPKHRT